MFVDKDLSNGSQNLETIRERKKLGKTTDFLLKSDDGFRLKQSKIGNLGSQELTLSYLCDSSNKMEFGGEQSRGNLFSALEKERCSNKGKGVISDSLNEDQRWVERDFLQLNGVSGRSSKRDVDKEGGGGEAEEKEKKRDKKLKLETLNLSLSLPDVSLSLNSPNPFPKPHAEQAQPVVLKPSRSTQSLVPSNNNTRTGSSDDFTAAPSLSYSYSHQFSHNPSCSLTRNSTDFYEYSIGSHRRENDPIWNCGEGTNGSVHSTFKPIGDGVSLSNHVGVSNGNGNGNGNFNGNGNALVQGNWPINKDANNSLYRAATGSENHSFFPSELPAKLMKDTQSGDSRGRGSDRQRGFENSDGGKGHRLTRPERLLREVVSESVTLVAQVFAELPEEIIESTKEYLKNVIVVPEKSEELSSLQKRLQRRSDFSYESLSKSHKAQLSILVAIKTGLADYLPAKNSLLIVELVEIFLQMRCPNVTCKSILPVEDCDCKICSSKKGFCSACMCPVCLKFDCANNTCSWVGCDVCSHWCHAVCGTESNLIKPGASLKGAGGTMEMQFHCLGCGHASEMFGFVKDVFLCCAKDWGRETLIKELDCVRRIFGGGEDSKGKDLQNIAAVVLAKLENNTILPSDACNAAIQFFKCAVIPDMVIKTPASREKRRSSKKRKCVFDNVIVLPNKEFKKNIYDSSSLVVKRRTVPHSALDAWKTCKISNLRQEFLEPLIPCSSLRIRDLFYGRSIITPEPAGDAEGAFGFVGDRCKTPCKSLEPEASPVKDTYDCAASVCFVETPTTKESDRARPMTPSTSGGDTMHTFERPDICLTLMDEEVGSREEDNGRQDGLTVRTRKLARNLRDSFLNLKDRGEKNNGMSLEKALEGKTRKESARLFYEILVLKSRGFIDVKQDAPYSNILVESTPQLETI